MRIVATKHQRKEDEMQELNLEPRSTAAVFMEMETLCGYAFTGSEQEGRESLLSNDNTARRIVLEAQFSPCRQILHD